MTIYEQIKLALNKKVNEIVSPSELKKLLKELYGINPESVILSDYRKKDELLSSFRCIIRMTKTKRTSRFVRIR